MESDSSALKWLQDWAYSLEGHYPPLDVHIIIENLDNPGWEISALTRDIGLNPEEYSHINWEETSDYWMQTYAKDGRFIVACGPHQLEQALEILRDFVSKAKPIEKKFETE